MAGVGFPAAGEQWLAAALRGCIYFGPSVVVRAAGPQGYQGIAFVHMELLVGLRELSLANRAWARRFRVLKVSDYVTLSA
jgi:hypothetical protein